MQEIEKGRAVHYRRSASSGKCGRRHELARMEKRGVIMFIRAFKFDPSTWYTTSLSRTGPGELDAMNGTAVKYVGPIRSDRRRTRHVEQSSTLALGKSESAAGALALQFANTPRQWARNAPFCVPNGD
jgi:hypothetical protein